VAFRVETTWPDDGSVSSGMTKTMATPALEEIEDQIVKRRRSLAGAVFLILELDGPFDGVIEISSGPMRYTLNQPGPRLSACRL
jgi:hypothetical protein